MRAWQRGQFMPEAFETFVATDMDYTRPGKGGYFRQHLIHKFESRLLADAKRILIFAIEFITYIECVGAFIQASSG